MRGLVTERNELFFKPRAIQMLKDGICTDDKSLLLKLGFKPTKTNPNSFYYGDHRNKAWKKDILINDILNMDFNTAKKLYTRNSL